jgi:heterodisulfide reductase subunit D
MQEKEKFNNPKIDINNLSRTQIMELYSCTRCGECLNWCPIYEADKREDILPRGKIKDIKRIIRKQHGIISDIFKRNPISRDLVENFSKNIYECTICGQCHYVCPVKLDSMEIWEKLRESLVKGGYGPLDNHLKLISSINNYDNPWQQPRKLRDRWTKRIFKNRPIKDATRERVEVLYFTGCTSAYDPNVNKVAINTSMIMQYANVDFGILGANEKCCASVALRIGERNLFEKIAKENIDRFNSIGIRKLVTSCAGCYKTIKQNYPEIGKLRFDVLHITEFILSLIDEGKIRFKELNLDITYHDPCHLGRHNNIYDPPREILSSIPGINLIEMERNREFSRCCGAGGGVKAEFPEIQANTSILRIKDAEKTGASLLVSACPFCYQALELAINSIDSNLVMKDLTDIIIMALIP